jgi:hypothetical protein
MGLILLLLTNGMLAGETLALKQDQLYMVWDPRLQGAGVNCALKVVEFKRHPPNPVVRPEHPWEKRGEWPRIELYGTVLWDAEGESFRMWYTTGAGVAYATSRDGVDWEKPVLGLHEFGGSRQNNLSSLGDLLPVVYRDTASTNPEQRWVKWSFQQRRGEDGVHVPNNIFRFFSPDGIRWTRQTPKAVLPGAPTHYLGGEAGDVVYTYWHEQLKKNVSYYKIGIPNANPAPNDQPKNRLGLRQSARFESIDGNQWSEPSWVLTRDDEDAQHDPYIQFYGLSVHPIGDLYVAFPWLYHCNEGTFDIGLACSTDTVNWVRPMRGQYVLPHAADGQWDSAMLMTSAHLIEKDGLWWLYYCGCPYPHKSGIKRYFAIGLAQTPIGRLAAARSWGTAGTWTVGPVKLSGKQLRINAAILDKLQVSILDEQGVAIPGWRSAIIRGNGISLSVQWPKGADLSVLKDRPIMLRFELDDAEVFSFTSTD